MKWIARAIRQGTSNEDCMTTDTTPLISGLSFAEGLRWHQDHLWFSDMYTGEVHRWSPSSGDIVVDTIDDAVSGIGWQGADGDPVVVSMEERLLVRLSPREVKSIVADLTACSSTPINDLVEGPNGAVYIGTFGFDFHRGEDFHTGDIVLVSADGSYRVVADDLRFPNGMVVTDGGTTLVCAESLGCRLSAFTVLPNGDLTQRRIWAELPQGTLPDGICLDADGAIWVASTETSECLRVVEGGDVVDRIAVGDRLAVACALGGEDGRTLFVATSVHLAPDDCLNYRDSRIETATVAVGAARP